MLNIKPFGERTPIILSPQLPLKAESICTFLGAMVNPISPWIVFGCFSNRIAAVSLQFWPVRKLKIELHHFACQTKENGYTYIYAIVYIRFSIYICIYNIKWSLYKRYLQMFLWAHRSIAAFSRNKAGRVDFQWIRRSATLIGQSSVHYSGSTAVPAFLTLSLFLSRCPSSVTYSIDNCSLSVRRYFRLKFWITQNENPMIFSLDFARLVAAYTFPHLPWFCWSSFPSPFPSPSLCCPSVYP